MATALLKLTDVQLGTSVTATNNFTLYQPSSPDGTVRWGVGNSGSVTDIVTLSSAGNVGIGTTSPLNLLSVYSTGNANIGIRSDTSASQTIGQYSTNTTASQLTLYKSRGTQASQSAVATGDSVGTLWFTAYGGTNNRQVSYITSAISNYTSDTNISTYIAFGTDNAGTGAGERMRIESSGNVAIGTSGQSAKLYVLEAGSTNSVATFVKTGTAQISIGNGGTSANYYDADTQYFRTGGGSEAMRLDRGGAGSASRLLLGTTTASAARFECVTAGTNTNGDWGFRVLNASGEIMFALINNGSFYTGQSPSSPYNATTGAAANVVITNDVGRLFRSTSSLRYKENVVDSQHGLAEVLQLRSVLFNNKNDEKKVVYGGLIAEEVDAAGLNEFVLYDDQGRPDAVHYGNMIGLCVKAIQELKAEIDELKAKVGA